jgi:hypothetical protein
MVGVTVLGMLVVRGEWRLVTKKVVFGSDLCLCLVPIWVCVCLRVVFVFA